MPVASLTIECPSCGARGAVDGVDPDVVPELVKCGHCRHIFEYQPTRYDRLRQDYDGEQSVWHLRVASTGSRSPVETPEDPEAVRLASLASVPTKRLLEAFRAYAGNRDNFQEGAVTDDAVIRVPGLWHLSFTGAEVRAELAKREHVPNKQEGQALRRARPKVRQKVRRR